MKTHVDLFSGIGGFALAAQWAGYETVLFVEIDPWCQKVLKRHWPNVPIIGDIRDVNKETVADAQSARLQGQSQCGVGGASKPTTGSDRGRLGVGWQSYGGIPCLYKQPKPDLPTIDLLTGGFPCQPFSVAGKRGGSNDDRFLWPQMLRVIAELRPRWVLGENVAGIINMALDDVLSDLEGEGYEVQAFVIPACAVNAPHRRDRVWIVAHDASERRGPRRAEWPRFGGEPAPADGGEVVAHSTRGEGDGRERGVLAGAKRSGQGRDTTFDVGREDVADTAEQGLQDGASEAMGRPGAIAELERPGGGTLANAEGPRLEGTGTAGDSRATGRTAKHGQRGGQADWWATEPELRRVLDELSERLDAHRLSGSPCATMVSVALEVIGAISTEAGRGEVLPVLREEDESAAVQRDSRRQRSVPPPEVLQQDVHESGVSEGRCHAVSTVEAQPSAEGHALRAMRNHIASWGTPLERGRIRQQARECDDLVRGVSRPMALGTWEDDAEALQLLLCGLWQACEEIGYVSKALSEIPQVWQSLTDQEKDWVTVRLGTGDPFHGEWPGTPRVATGVKNRVNRLRGLGNAIVPQVAYQILKAIREIDDEVNNVNT